MRLIARHWPTIVGVLSNLPSIWRAFVSVFDWGARVDLVIAHWHELGWIGDVAAFLANPPSWFFAAAFVIGISLIFWDSRRHRSRNAVNSAMMAPHPNSFVPERGDLKISLTDAARHAYSETEGTMFATMAEVAGRSLSGQARANTILEFYARGMSRHSTMWGCKEPSVVSRSHDLTNYNIVNRDGVLVALENWGTTEIADLKVSQRGLDAFIERVHKFPEVPI
jgi:hypothetical protein